MSARIITGDALEQLRLLPDESVHCVVTSPPYFGLRDYGVGGQLGLELTPEAYIAALVGVFREARRVLRSDGTCWIVIGDSYAGSWGAQSRRVTDSDNPSWHSSQIKNHPKRARNTGTVRMAGVKPKDLYGIPWMLAFALRADDWWLRRDIIWHKPNPMPESITDRCTTAHEYMFMLTKSERYSYDAAAISEPLATPIHAPGNNDPGKIQGTPSHQGGNSQFRDSKVREWGRAEGRNRRSVWTISTEAFAEAHFATFPTTLVEPCILAGCPKGGTVLDPFGGAGTTGLVADRLGRNAILIELNPEYADMARRRLERDAGMFAQVAAE